MHDDALHSPASLSDAALVSRLLELAQDGRTTTVELIGHLAEIDARKLYRGEGYGSLFDYCTGALRLSEHAAYNRIEAGRAAQAFPVVLERLADGSINLTTLRLLAPHLRPENHLAVLAEAAGKTKRGVEAIVARLAPRADVPDSLRKLPDLHSSQPADPAQESPNRTTEQPAILAAAEPSQSGEPLFELGALPGTAHSRLDTARAVVAPLAPERYRIQFTIGHETHEKLRFVQDLMRRENPAGDLAVIFDRGLTLLLEEIAKKKVAATSKPRSDRPSATAPTPGIERRSRHIPAAVKRAVWSRDQGRCAFVARRGRRCQERAYLEFHHIEPYAIGGEPTVSNISLRCRTHNAYEAELAFPELGSGTRSRTSSTVEAPNHAQAKGPASGAPGCGSSQIERRPLSG